MTSFTKAQYRRRHPKLNEVLRSKRSEAHIARKQRTLARDAKRLGDASNIA